MSRRTGLNFRYQMYGPVDGRPLFRVMKVFVVGGAETVSHEAIEKLNTEYKAGRISRDEGAKIVKNLISQLYASEGVVKPELGISPSNERVLNKYCEAKYGTKSKELRSAFYEIRRALAYLGKVDIMTGTKKQLSKSLEMLEGSQRNRAVNKINSVLVWLKRDFKLDHAKVQPKSVRYIDLKDFKKLLDQIETTEARLMHEVCFYTGITIGEAFALTPSNYKPRDKELKVSKIMTADGTRKDSKLAERTVVVIPQGHNALMDWFKVKQRISENLHASVSRQTRRAALTAFPADESKQISFSDLRHCYAMHLLSEGVPLPLVASCLGVSEAYAQERYPKFEISSKNLALIKNILQTG